MKKVLYATTALVAFGGAAAAEVSLSGYAEMGIKGGSAGETQFHNDIDVKFSLSGESETGISFGATIDLDEVNSSGEVGGTTINNNGTPLDPTDDYPQASNFNRSSVWIEGDFGKLTLGDTDGGYDWAMQEIYMGSALTDDHSTHGGAYLNSGADGTYDGQILRYENTFGDFGFAVSTEFDDSGTFDPVIGVGVKWSGDMGGVELGVGVGYQTVESTDITGISVSAAMAGGLDVRLNYSRDGSGADWMGVGVGYSAGDVLVQANYGEYEFGASGWGLVGNYDLGGGASVQAGFGDTDGGESTWSLGLGLSF